MENLTFSNLRQIATFCNELFSTPNFREVANEIDSLSNDFKVDSVRFILADDIDEIQAEELTNDLYCLGCFNASFIAEQCNWPIELVEAAQKGGAYEALGQAISDNADMVDFAKAYSSADGYGHHFNRYDFGEQTLTINGNEYYVFDQHGF